MAIILEMEQLGANVTEALQRLGGKEAFYEKLLLRLPASVESNPVMSFLEEGNVTQATANAHALKGVFGNLSLSPLYQAYTQIVTELRAGNAAHAKEILTDILPLQERFLEAIAKYQ